MVNRFIIAALATAFLAGSAHADGGRLIHPTVDVRSVQLDVHWVANRFELQKEVAKHPGWGSTGGEPGYAVLMRNRKTGAWTCHIFVVKPTHLNDSKTLILGHEVLHCLAGAYHR